ncbi:MAG: cbb3-type cytochrome oxidase assembly protein CcoS [Gallionella sp.]
MEVIYSLIPGMIFIGVVLVGILIWNVKKGQYEDMEGDGSRILMDSDDGDDFTRHPDDRKK